MDFASLPTACGRPHLRALRCFQPGSVSQLDQWFYRLNFHEKYQAILLPHRISVIPHLCLHAGQDQVVHVSCREDGLAGGWKGVGVGVGVDRWHGTPYPNPEGLSNSLTRKERHRTTSQRHLLSIVSAASPMCSLLASQLSVYRRGFLIARAAPQWQQSSMHLWHSIRQKQLLGLQKLLNYEDVAVPDIGSQEIRLWSGNEFLGLMPVADVLKDHVRPGTMLRLRSRSSRIAGGPPRKVYDYQLRRLKTDGGSSSQSGKIKGYRAKEIHLAANMTPALLQNSLQVAYKFLDPERASSSKGEEATVPVEFHIQVRPPPKEADLSLFMPGRVDLHPSVILRALPEGVFQILQPKADLKRGEAVWVVGTEHPKEMPYGVPNKPRAIAEKAEKLFNEKRKRLKGLVNAGELTTNRE